MTVTIMDRIIATSQDIFFVIRFCSTAPGKSFTTKYGHKYFMIVVIMIKAIIIGIRSTNSIKTAPLSITARYKRLQEQCLVMYIFQLLDKISFRNS